MSRTVAAHARGRAGARQMIDSASGSERVRAEAGLLRARGPGMASEAAGGIGTGASDQAVVAGVFSDHRALSEAGVTAAYGC